MLSPSMVLFNTLKGRILNHAHHRENWLVTSDKEKHILEFQNMVRTIVFTIQWTCEKQLSNEMEIFRFHNFKVKLARFF